MKTPHTHAEEFIAALTELGFKPARSDSADRRNLELTAANGRVAMRCLISYEGESEPCYIGLIKFCTHNHLIEWESLHLTAYMPSAGLLALIQSAI